MRREWSGWIKTRQWSEFEKLAKTEPSQSLADTVAELELGFPDKPDKRALRKILFLLSLSGYEPRQIDEPFNASMLEVPPLLFAFMVSPDGAGDTVLTYGREEHGRVSWLIVHLTYRDGITRAIEDTTTIEEAQTRLLRLRNMTPKPCISSEIPVDFALSSIAQAVPRTRNLPPVMAYWRAKLPKDFSTPHPAQELEAKNLTSDELHTLMTELEPTRSWRLELGALAPALEEMVHSHENQQLDFNDSEAWHRVLEPHREYLFAPETLADHRRRLLDLAYVMHLKGDSRVGEVMAIAKDLDAYGHNSVYGKTLAARTLILLVETIRRQNAKER